MKNRINHRKWIIKIKTENLKIKIDNKKQDKKIKQKIRIKKKSKKKR